MTPESRGRVAAAALFAGGVLLMADSTPAWCSLLALASVAWRVLIGCGVLREPKPRRGVKFVFGAVTALLVVAIAMSFRTLNGLAAGSALLVVMGALKLVEARTRRDDGIVIGVALFLLLSAALSNQALWRVPLYLALAWAAFVAMALVAHPGAALRVRAAMRLATRALAMALPLAAVCFLFFPRVAGQFWAIDRSVTASTGLSDEMSPGSIGTLATEYDPAFRVRFESGAPPPRAALYFRGIVLNQFDGFTWRRLRANYLYQPPALEGRDPVRYRITLEPTDRPWLIALDTVLASPRHDMALSHDNQLRLMSGEVTAPLSYDAESFLTTRSARTLSDYARRFETQLPSDRNPRAVELARTLRAQSRDDADFARRALEWFRAQGLEYTLDPGTTTIDSVDTTLFDSKRGFCAHFASAYATLMRAAKVPARVVTGYLGGEWNAVGGYLLVHQSDAHAWTEVWLDGRGWTRIDPTAVVAPERLQRGVFDLFGDALPAASVFVHRNAWLRRMSLLWDGANQWWQEQVVDFNLRAQLDFLRRFGIESPDWQHLGWAFVCGLLAWLAWISLALRRSVARVRPDRIARAWLRATRRLERVARRESHEGPLAYAARVGALRPQLAAPVAELARRYARLRFGPAAPAAEIAQFERTVRKMGSLPIS